MSFIDTWIERGLMRLGSAINKVQGQKLGTTLGEWARVPLAMAGGHQWMENPAAHLTGQKMYNTLSWINASISIPANITAPVALEVKQTGDVGEDDAMIPNHPFVKLLKKPNPLMSRKEFLTATYSYYLLTGNAYWWINADDQLDPVTQKPINLGEPDELWIINPADIFPMTDGRLFISHYEYTAPDGTLLRLAPSSIVHFKRFNPENPFIGISAVETLIFQANADMGRVRMDSLIYNKSNGTPPGILAFADNFSEEEWLRMLKDFEEGSKAMRRFLMLRNVKAGGVQWLQNQLSNRDQQMIETRGFTREEIFTVLAPGLASMLAINATEANSKTGKATLMEFVSYPMLCDIDEKITTDLLPRYGENLEAKFEEVRTKDRVLELQEQTAYATVHTVEEVRQKYFKDKPLGDKRDGLFPIQVNAATGDGSTPEPTAPQGGLPGQPGGNPGTGFPVSPNMQDAGNPGASGYDGSNLDNVSANNLEGDQYQAELKRWKRVAKKAIDAGKPIKEFETSIIPEDIANEIREGLKYAQTHEDIEFVFKTSFDITNGSDLAMLARAIEKATKILSL